jgi:dihydroorotate dehydrogenase electron transfer subunit
MDGSFGAQGLVSQLFSKHLQNPDANTLVLSCGPMLMLNAVHDYLKDTPAQCQVSLENLMACGIGCCLGCVVKTKDAQGVEKYTRVCHEGPVFSARVICWGVDHETGCRTNS